MLCSEKVASKKELLQEYTFTRINRKAPSFKISLSYIKSLDDSCYPKCIIYAALSDAFLFKRINHIKYLASDDIFMNWPHGNLFSVFLLKEPKKEIGHYI